MHDWLRRIALLVLTLTIGFNWFPSAQAQTIGEVNRITSIIEDKSRAFVQLNTTSQKQIPAPSIQYLPGDENETILAADFAGLIWNKPSEVIYSPTDGLSQVRIGQFENNPPICRVSMVATRPRVLHEIEFDSAPGQLLIKWPKGKENRQALAMAGQTYSPDSNFSPQAKQITTAPMSTNSNVSPSFVAMTTHPAFSPPVQPQAQFVPRGANTQLAYRPIQAKNAYKPLPNANTSSSSFAPPPIRQTSTILLSPMGKQNAPINNYAFSPSNPSNTGITSPLPNTQNVKPAPLIAQAPTMPKAAPQVLPSFKHPTLANPVRLSSPVRWTGGSQRRPMMPWLIVPMINNSQPAYKNYQQGTGQMASTTPANPNSAITPPTSPDPFEPVKSPEPQTPVTEQIIPKPLAETPLPANQLLAPVPDNQLNSNSRRLAKSPSALLLGAPLVSPNQSPKDTKYLFNNANLELPKIEVSGIGPVLVEIQAGTKLAYHTFRLHDPERYVVDIDNITSLPDREMPEFKPNPLLKSLRISNPSTSTTTRLVLDLANTEVDVKETTSAGATSLLLTLSTTSFPIAEGPLPDDTTVVLDPGHGGSDPGAQRGDVQEKELTLQIVNKLRKMLEGKGVKVITTRADDTFVSLENRVNLTNTVNPKAFISIHINSLETNKNIHGVETYFLDEKSKELANSVHASLVAKLKVPDRSLRKARFYVINHTPVPAVLAEVGYISNKEEREKLVSSDYQDNVADALAHGVMLYLYQSSNKLAESQEVQAKKQDNQVQPAPDMKQKHKPSSLAVAPPIPRQQENNTP